jgi:hypothetical protein
MATITLGITGHRYLAEIDKIRSGLEGAIESLVTSYQKANFRVLSALAEGADQLVTARLLLLPRTRLWVVLPFPEDEYLERFTSLAVKEDFQTLIKRADRIIKMPVEGSQGDGYLNAGRYIVNHSDVLIAIWDGKPAQGEGGTGDLVTQAQNLNMPLIWIHAGNRQPGTEIPISLGMEQGTVTNKNLPHQGRLA